MNFYTLIIILSLTTPNGIVGVKKTEKYSSKESCEEAVQEYREVYGEPLTSSGFISCIPGNGWEIVVK